MDIFKASVDELARYIDFLVSFSGSPQKVFDALELNDAEPTRSKVRPKLLLYMMLSVGFAVVLTVLGTAVGMAPDSSWIVTVVGRIDQKALPLAVVALVVIVAAAWHGLAIAVGWLLARISETPSFKGEIAGSINAGLALTSWYLPLLTAVVVSVRVAALHLGALPPMVLLVAVLPLACLFPLHFVLAFAAAHRVSAAYVFTLFSLTVVGLVYLGDLLR